MGIARLNIEQQYARISVDMQPAKISVEMPEGHLQVSQQSPQMTVEWENSNFSVDFERARAAIANNRANLATSNSMTIVPQKAISNIEYSHAHANMQTGPDSDVGKYKSPEIKLEESVRNIQKKANATMRVPRYMDVSPDIKYNRGDFNISWSDYEFSVEWIGDTLPQITVEPYSIDIIIDQKPYIKIYLVEEALPKATGRNLDTHI